MHVVTTIKYGCVVLSSSINTTYLLTLRIDLLCIIQTTMPQHNYTMRVGKLYKWNKIEEIEHTYKQTIFV